MVGNKTRVCWKHNILSSGERIMKKHVCVLHIHAYTYMHFHSATRCATLGPPLGSPRYTTALGPPHLVRHLEPLSATLDQSPWVLLLASVSYRYM